MGNTIENHAPPSEVDSFVKLAKTYPVQAALLMFWMNRHSNPEFSIEITPKDLVAFKQAMEYLDVVPELRVFRPEGIPAVEAQPAHGNRRAIAGRPARPGKNVVVIQMLDADGNSIVPIENNEEDQKAGRRIKDIVHAREQAGQLATALLQQMAQGLYSNNTIQEAARILQTLGSVE